MPNIAPKSIIELSKKERKELESTVRKSTSAQRDVLRASIVLLAADGMSNYGIARKLRCASNTVRTWRRRFAEKRVDGLGDEERSGRPRIYDDQVRATVKAIACERPSQLGLPLSRLSLNDIRKAAETQLQRTPGMTTIQEWLSADAIRPWYRRSWIFPRDPQFAEKAAPILDLYRGFWKGKRLDDSDVILSIDEKPVKMVTRRVEPPAAGKTVRYEFEYTRHGVATYIAALDVRTGNASGIVVKSCTKKVFRSFVTGLVRKKRGGRLFLIMDNGTAHRPSTFTEWTERHSNCISVFTPVHASWLNQVEIYFSITGKKALTPMNIGGIEELSVTLSRFEAYYNSSAEPFDWKFRRKDMKRMLSKLAA